LEFAYLQTNNLQNTTYAGYTAQTQDILTDSMTIIMNLPTILSYGPRPRISHP